MKNLVLCRTFPVQILILPYENPNVCKRILPTHGSIAVVVATADAAVADDPVPVLALSLR